MTNLGLAIERAFENPSATGGSDLWLLEVNETSRGTEDLNQDGDTLDMVVFTYAPLSGAFVNLGLAVPSGSPLQMWVASPLAAFAVGETDQGDTDLNGDGDALDGVLHVWNARTGTARNLELAVATGTVLVDGPFVLFCVSEEEQGADLDGDGAADGFVTHIYDAATDAVRNTGLQRIPSWNDVASANGYLAFGARETPASGDLNGDGDAFDLSVVQVYGPSDTLQNTGLAIESGATTLAYADGRWGVAVSESEQGETDLNGDGDALDRRLCTFDPGAGTVADLEVDSFDSVLAPSSGFEPDFLVVLFEEHRDLNGNGGPGNFVPALCEARTGRLVTLGRSVPQGPLSRRVVTRLGPHFVLKADEAGEDRDLNGDGDKDDEVAQILDASRTRASTLATECRALTSDAENLVMDRWEVYAGEDWNRDHDLFDRQLFRYDVLTGRTIGTGLFQALVADIDEVHALLLVDEHDSDADLNGDGDRDDEVFTVYELATGSRWDLGLAGISGATSFLFPGTSVHRLGLGGAVLLVDEPAQGQDLNGDGDALDTVLHRVDFAGELAGAAPLDDGS